MQNIFSPSDTTYSLFQDSYSSDFLNIDQQFVQNNLLNILRLVSLDLHGHKYIYSFSFKI
jgi:hypothetical protein